MKTIARAALPALLIGLIWACSAPLGGPGSDTAGGSLTINLTTGLSGSTIAPGTTGAEVEIASYSITGTGPGGDAFSATSLATASHSETGLALGEWSVTATAYNADGLAVAEGTSTVEVTNGADSSVSVVLVAAFEGAGGVDISLSWPSATITDPQFDASLTMVDTVDDGSITLAVDGLSATYVAETLDAGYYTLLISVKDGLETIHTITEIVRIVPGATTIATFPLTVQNLEFPATSPPDFSVAGGEYVEAQSVTLSSVTPDATIRYTLNGTPPSRTVGRLYTDGVPVEISSSATLRAVAYTDERSVSEVVSATYTISGDKPATPTVSVYEGVYFDPIEVSLFSETTGSGIQILYTLDGSDPGSGGEAFESGSPITISTDTTLKAITANYSNFETSDLIVAEYRFTGYVPAPTVSLDSGSYSEVQTATITCDTSGATIYYTLDGTDPRLFGGTEYTGPITIDRTSTLRAYAILLDWNDSSLVERTYTLSASQPVFSVVGGVKTTAVNLDFSTTTPSTSVYYTTDGSIPSSENGVLYESGTPVAIANDAVIRAVAVREGWDDSEVVTEQYIFTVDDIVTDVLPGLYEAEKSVALSTTTPESAIYYTIDGSEPSSSDFLYESPIPVEVSRTIRAVAIRDDWIPAVFYGEYELKTPEPTVSPTPEDSVGTVPASVTITGITESNFAYTVNSLTPSFSVPVSGQKGTITSPGSVTETFDSTQQSQGVTLKARSTKIGWSPSDVVVARYYPSPRTNLIGEYLLDGDGTDSSGSANNATLTGSPVQISDRFGSDGAALDLDGSTQTIDTPIAVSGGSWSFSLWAKPDTFVGTSYLFNQPNIASLQYDAGSGNLVFQTGNGSGMYNSVSFSYDFVVGEWVHLVLVTDGSSATVYADGTNEIAGTGTVSIAGSTGSLSFGSGFDGTFDDIRVYQTALTATEVLQLYNDQGWTGIESPEPVGPLGGVDVTTATPSISWMAAADAASYELQISDRAGALPDATAVTVTATASIGSTESHTVETAIPDGETRYWRVRSVNTAGDVYSRWTEPQSFTVALPGGDTATTLTVDLPEEIDVTFSSTVTVTKPDDLTITATASSVSSYEWLLDGDSITGSSSSLTIDSELLDAGPHWVTVLLTSNSRVFSQTLRIMVEESE